MSLNMKSFSRQICSDQRGTVAIMAGFAIAAFTGFSAIVVDVGYLYHAQRVLQDSADAAARAGAQDINCCSSTPGKAITTATSYSAVSGGKNADPNVTATMTSGYPQLKCFTSTGVSCSGPDNANGIVVKQQASVPTFFGKALGIDSVQISATSTAGSQGGTGHPADVEIIVDTTGSMNSSDSSCSISGATREDCAFAGVRALLTGLTPAYAHVGIMVFPGVTAVSEVSKDYDCNASPTPAIAKYSQTVPTTPVYQIIPLASDYKTSTGALNTASNLVKAARGGPSGCTQGISAVGGVGSFYADVVTAAQQDLVTNGRANVTRMIIFLSDGSAGASSSNMPAAKLNNQCQEAITAAVAATAAGTKVYTIAYGASTSTTSSTCTTDSPAISACSTLQQMASDSAKFYSDTTGGTSTCTSAAHPITDLSAIFQDIGAGMLGARLLPDGTT